jgi:hypothetical protein
MVLQHHQELCDSTVSTRIPVHWKEIGRELLCENVPEDLGPENSMYTGSHLVGGRGEDYEPRQVILDEPSHFFLFSVYDCLRSKSMSKKSANSIDASS